jgi:DNA-directed RNA polymerase specialized sigma subunit
MRRAIYALKEDLGRHPTDIELCRHMQISRKGLENIRKYGNVRFRSPYIGDSNDEESYFELDVTDEQWHHETEETVWKEGMNDLMRSSFSNGLKLQV